MLLIEKDNLLPILSRNYSHVIILRRRIRNMERRCEYCTYKRCNKLSQFGKKQITEVKIVLIGEQCKV